MTARMSTVGTASRFTWALGWMPLAPDHRVLEVGCGHGIALGLVAARLRTGCVLGIDRSAKMIAQAARRNADAVRAGHVLLRTGTLASVDLGPEPFDLAFAINVSLFAGDAHVELTRLRERLRAGASLFLFHEAPVAGHAERFGAAAARNLEAHGFKARRLKGSPLRAAVVGTVP